MRALAFTLILSLSACSKELRDAVLAARDAQRILPFASFKGPRLWGNAVASALTKTSPTTAARPMFAPFGDARFPM